jgi:hypothetical protein
MHADFIMAGSDCKVTKLTRFRVCIVMLSPGITLWLLAEPTSQEQASSVKSCCSCASRATC